MATIWVTGSEFIAFDGGVATDSVSMGVVISSVSNIELTCVFVIPSVSHVVASVI